MSEPSFLEAPTDSGGDWDCQCARCGSDFVFETCATCCGDGFVGHDCGEDTCCCLHPFDNVLCDDCHGEGVIGDCGSDPEWCAANPLPSRESVERGRIEWFRVNGYHVETEEGRAR